MSGGALSAPSMPDGRLCPGPTRGQSPEGAEAAGGGQPEAEAGLGKEGGEGRGRGAGGGGCPPAGTARLQREWIPLEGSRHLVSEVCEEGTAAHLEAKLWRRKMLSSLQVYDSAIPRESNVFRT